MAYMTMYGVLNASVSAGSSHLAASVTCRPQRSSPSAATEARGDALGRLGGQRGVPHHLALTSCGGESVLRVGRAGEDDQREQE